MTILLALLALASPAHACDARALTAALDEASPVNRADAFAALAACDPDAAKRVASKHIPVFLANSGDNAGFRAAIDVGGGDAIKTLVSSYELADRTKVLAYLGKQCAESPAVAAWFVQASKDPKFWENLWFRGLDDCRTPEVKALLAGSIADPEMRSKRDIFLSVMEVYARNAGADAIPALVSMVDGLSELEKAKAVQAFADAANVGSREGMNAEAAKKAVAALIELMPTLTGKTANQLRTTLQALGDPEAAKRAVTSRWPERFDAGYRYGATAVEKVTCKNGKTQERYHVGVLTDAGTDWPDGLGSRLEDVLTEQWDLGAAGTKCKGETALTVTMMEEPIGEEAPMEEFQRVQLKAFRASASADKVEELEHEPAAF